MVDSTDFSTTIRHGSRSGNAMVVVHCRTDEDASKRLVGFIVPKPEVALATRRNTIKRRLRHLMAARVADQPDGARIVVRAGHRALGQDSATLGVNLDRALTRAWRKWDEREQQRGQK